MQQVIPGDQPLVRDTVQVGPPPAGGLRAIHTPGHSPGHPAFLHEPTATVFVGDALFHRGSLALGPAALAADPAVRAESLRALPSSLAAIGFAHGPALSGAEVDVFHAWLEGLRTAQGGSAARDRSATQDRSAA